MELKEYGVKTAPKIILLAGFPDNHSVWDNVVDYFQDTYHIFVGCLPDFDRQYLSKPDGYSIDEVISLFEIGIEKISKQNERVNLILHDWGSLIGINYYSKRPEKVLKLVTLDVGANSNDSNPDSPKLLGLAVSLWYQLNFAFIFWLGKRISSTLAQLYFRCFMFGWRIWGPCNFGATFPRPKAELKWWMCYPYYLIIYCAEQSCYETS